MATWKEIATKDYVDTQVASADDNLSIVADTGSGTLNLDTQTLRVLGTNNEIDTSMNASNQLQIGLNSSPHVANITVSTQLNASRIYDSSEIDFVLGTLGTFDFKTNDGATDTIIATLDASGDLQLDGGLTLGTALPDTQIESAATWNTVSSKLDLSGGDMAGHIDMNGAYRLLNVNRVSFGVLGGNGSISAVLDEDNMISDSDTAVPTQQSVKAYADAVSEVSKYYYETKIVNFTGTDSSVYLPMSGPAEVTTLSGQNEITGFIPPYNGSLEKVIIRSTNAHDGVFRISILEAESGDTIPDSESGRYDSADTLYANNSNVTLDLTGTLPLGVNQLRSDRMYAFQLITPDQPGDINITLVFKWILE